MAVPKEWVFLGVSRLDVYPKKQGVEYTALGLTGEAGEIANKVNKVLRGDYDKDTLPASNSGYDTAMAVYWDKTWPKYPGQVVHDEYPYNGIGARHLDRMANVAFLDAHAEPMFVADLMDPDRRHWGQDIWE